MKFWNKNKAYRETWTKVDGPPLWKREEVKKWCQQHPSTARFYFTPTKKILLDWNNSPDVFASPGKWLWYFEDSQDALAFSLTWSVKIR